MTALLVPTIDHPSRVPQEHRPGLRALSSPHSTAAQFVGFASILLVLLSGASTAQAQLGLPGLNLPWQNSQRQAAVSPPGNVGTTPHPSVVRIIVPEKSGMSFGSGSLIDVTGDYGLIITNWHVVRDAADEISVKFPDGFRSPAQIIKTDKDWDLAALSIRRPTIAVPLPISVIPPQPGEPLAIAGYGSGDYRTAVGKMNQFLSPGDRFPYEMVEVSVEARQGDSGGPILNQRGEIAGVLFGSGRGYTSGSYGGRVAAFLASVIPANKTGLGESNLASAVPTTYPQLAAVPFADRSREAGLWNGQRPAGQRMSGNGGSSGPKLEPIVDASQPITPPFQTMALHPVAPNSQSPYDPPAGARPAPITSSVAAGVTPSVTTSEKKSANPIQRLDQSSQSEATLDDSTDLVPIAMAPSSKTITLMEVPQQNGMQEIPSETYPNSFDKETAASTAVSPRSTGPRHALNLGGSPTAPPAANTTGSTIGSSEAYVPHNSLATIGHANLKTTQTSISQDEAPLSGVMVHSPPPPRGVSSATAATATGSTGSGGSTSNISTDQLASAIWQQVGGNTPFDQAKAILAMIGIGAIVLKVWRLNSTPETAHEEE